MYKLLEHSIIIIMIITFNALDWILKTISLFVQSPMKYRHAVHLKVL
jgi:hypothetical protein